MFKGFYNLRQNYCFKINIFVFTDLTFSAKFHHNLPSILKETKLTVLISSAINCTEIFTYFNWSIKSIQALGLVNKLKTNTGVS